jgi:K+ transporter
VNGNARINNISYSVQSSQNQKIRGYGTDLSVKWQFMDRTFLESNFNYNQFRNERFDFEQNIAIWNASVRRLFGKTNRIEARLAAFDLLNQRVTINQSGTQNFVTNSVAPTPGALLHAQPQLQRARLREQAEEERLVVRLDTYFAKKRRPGVPHTEAAELSKIFFFSYEL